MSIKYLKLIFGLLCLSLIGTNNCLAQNPQLEGQIKVAMRAIGHEVLLATGDSVSRVLPIEKVGPRYKIAFATKFALDPKDLFRSVDRIMLQSQLARNYLVEVESCDSAKVVYSYQMGGIVLDSGLIPCGGRLLPEDCYQVFFSILDVQPIAKTEKQSAWLSAGTISLLLGALVLIGLVFYSKRQTRPLQSDPNSIRIGDYSYDKKTMILSHKGTQTELSSKEADLLLLLYSEENKVLERENILKLVWGDKGDYVGRTLDVFISKLRKKLSADPNLKIINIRGIGYKFVLAEKK